MNLNPPKISRIPETMEITLSASMIVPGRETSEAPLFNKYNPNSKNTRNTKFDLNLNLISDSKTLFI